MHSFNFSEKIIENTKKQGKNAILVVGEEPVTKKHINNILQKFSVQNSLEQIKIDIETSTKLESMIAKFANDSLFSEATLFKINILTGRISDEIKNFFIYTVQKNDANKFFIFYFKQTIKDFSKLKWTKQLEAKSLILEANEAAPEKFKEAILIRANSYNLNFTDDAVELFSQLTQGNFLFVENEFIKLQLIFGDKKINTKVLIRHLSNGSKYDAFDLINASMSGDKKIVIDTVKCLYENGIDPLSINGLFAWIFKAIVKFKHSNNLAPSYGDFTKMRIFGSSQIIVKKSLSILTEMQIETALIRIKDIDLICKGLRQGDPWLELNRLSFGLARILNKSKV